AVNSPGVPDHVQDDLTRLPDRLGPGRQHLGEFKLERRAVRPDGRRPEFLVTQGARLHGLQARRRRGAEEEALDVQVFHGSPIVRIVAATRGSSPGGGLCQPHGKGELRWRTRVLASRTKPRLENRLVLPKTGSTG